MTTTQTPTTDATPGGVDRQDQLQIDCGVDGARRTAVTFASLGGMTSAAIVEWRYRFPLCTSRMASRTSAPAPAWI